MITTPRRTLRGEKGGNKPSIKALNCNDDDDGEAIKNSKVRGWPQYLHGFKIRKKAKKSIRIRVLLPECLNLHYNRQIY